MIWLKTRCVDGRLDFTAVSDSAIVSGLIAILMRVYSGRQSSEIIDTTPEFIGLIGLDEHLSPTRSNGLIAMIKANFGEATFKKVENVAATVSE